MPLDVIMPALGMAQDSGLLVSWLKQPGDAVAEGDVLFEVETDKATMEVEAQGAGFLTDVIAKAGDEVPVGQVIARISATPAEGASAHPPLAAPSMPEPKAALAKPLPASVPITMPMGASGRILASPKARRLVLEAGLDLAWLADTGLPQPYHVRDLELLRTVLPERPTTTRYPQTYQASAPSALRALPAQRLTTPITSGEAVRRLEADLQSDGFAAFCDWAAKEAGVADAAALLTGLAAASLRRADPHLATMDLSVAVENFGTDRRYRHAYRAALGSAEPDAHSGTPDLRVRDLRRSVLSTLALGAEEVPVLSLVCRGKGLRITLECSPTQLSASAAIRLLGEFAARIHDPLRHLL